MNEQDIERLTAGLENERLEFKEELTATAPQEARHHVMRTVSAFYNTKGGVLLFGIRDKTGEVVGLEDPQKVETGFSQQLKACLPGVIPQCEFILYKGKPIFVVTCPKGPSPPYLIKGYDRPFIRLGSTNVEATADQIAQMYRERSSEPQDRQPLLIATLDDIDIKAAQAYLRETSDAATPTNTLRALAAEGLVTSDDSGHYHPTVAGMLLFGKAPQTFLPNAIIRADVKLDDDQDGWDDIQTITGSLFEQIRSAEAFVKRHVPVSAKIQGFRRVEIAAIPLEALREAIVNALVHRDYRDATAEMHIRIRRGGISVLSPGGVLPPLTIEIVLQGNFTPRTRNATIAEAFIRLGKFMERRGTGIERIRELMRKAQLDEPLFEDENNSFRVIFSAPMSKAKPTVEEEVLISDEEVARLGLDESDLRVLELVQEQSEVRARDVERVLEKSRPTVVQTLSELVEKRVLERTTESKRDPNVAYRLHRRYTKPDEPEKKTGQAGLGI